jgi:O-antigen/teichoic acid export membrane protein
LRRRAIIKIAVYAAGNLIAGAAGLLSVFVLSRLLSAEQYGQYASVLVLVGLCQIAGFNWLQSAIVRLHPEEADEIGRAQFAQAVRLGFVLSAVFVSIAWTIGLGALEAITADKWLPGIGGLSVLLCGAWAAVGQSWIRMTAPPWRFVTARTAQSLGGLAFALAGLALWPGDVLVALLALSIASLLAAAVASFPITGALKGFRPLQPRLRQLWAYGAPLTAVALGTFMLASTDRLLIAYSIGPAAAGAYAVAAGTAVRAMNLILLPIASAIRPQIFMELNHRGRDSAQQILNRMSGWLIAVGLPLTVVFVCAPRSIASAVTVGQLADEAAEVLPWTGIGALLSAFLTLHFATAFQIARRTDRMLLAVVPAAAFNVLSNVVLLPRFGIVAAGWSMVASYVVALVLAIRVASGPVRMAFSFSDAGRTAAACVPLAGFLQLEFHGTAYGFILMMGGGALVYAAGAFALNVVDIRSNLIAVIRKSRRTQRG